jgi:hypothetical protein
VSKYSQLRKYCKGKGIKVKEVPTSALKDFCAMNDEAAKKMGYPKMKDKSVVIDKNVKSATKYRTLKHELVEMHLMENKRYPYWKAHKVALKAEAKPYKPKGRY